MEISNRSIVLLCVTAIAVAFIVRRGPSAPPPETASPATLTSTSQSTLDTKTREPLDSDFRMIDQSMPNTDDHAKEVKSPTPVMPSTTPAASTDTTEEDDPLADLYSDDQPTEDGLTAPRASRENSAAWAYDAPNDREGNFTDREMFDRMMGFMDDEQRAQFRVVWTAMTPEERDQFLDQMRGNR